MALKFKWKRHKREGFSSKRDRNGIQNDKQKISPCSGSRIGFIHSLVRPGRLPFRFGLKEPPAPQIQGHRSAVTSRPFHDIEIHVSEIVQHDDRNVLHSSRSTSIHFYIVDQTTGRCLSSSSPHISCASVTPSKTSQAILPTNGGTVSYEWNANTILPIHYSELFSTDTLLLFEVIDGELSPPTAGPRRGSQRFVAWGFFRPERILSSLSCNEEDAKSENGTDCMTIDVDLQIYKWKKETMLMRKQAELLIYQRVAFDPSAPSHVPDAYIQFLMQRKAKFKSCLCIQVKPKLRMKSIANDIANQKDTDTIEENTNLIHRNDKKKCPWANLKRDALDECRVPTTIIKTINHGATALRFSHSGKCLAFSGVQSSFHQTLWKYNLRVYSCATSDVRLLHEFQGHASVIYDLVWSENDKHILTASADGTCKLWYVGCGETEHRIGTKPHLERVFQVYPPVLAVTCASFLKNWAIGSQKPDDSKCHLFIIAGTFDGGLHLWDGSDGKELGLIGGQVHHKYVTSIVTTSSRIYSAGNNLIIWGLSNKGKEHEQKISASDRSGKDFIPLRQIDLSKVIDNKFTGMDISILTQNKLSNSAKGFSEKSGCERLLITKSNRIHIYDLASQRLIPTRFTFENGRKGNLSSNYAFLQTRQHMTDLCLSSLSRSTSSPDGHMIAGIDGGNELRIWAHDGKVHAVSTYQMPIRFFDDFSCFIVHSKVLSGTVR